MGPKKKSGAQNRANKAVKDALSQKNKRTLKDCGWKVLDQQQAPRLPAQVFLYIHGFFSFLIYLDVYILK